MRIVPFDEEAFYKNPAEFDVVTTSLNTGKSVVFTKGEISETGIDKVLIASSSIPLLSRPADIRGSLFLDGGVSDSIPVKYAFGLHQKVVVVLTRPRGYRKGKLRNAALLKMVFGKYPDFLLTLLHRNEEYNKALEFCEEMARDGKLFIIAPLPEFSIGRTEKDLEKRMSLYHHGYNLMSQKAGELAQFLKAV